MRASELSRATIAISRASALRDPRLQLGGKMVRQLLLTLAGLVLLALTPTAASGEDSLPPPIGRGFNDLTGLASPLSTCLEFDADDVRAVPFQLVEIDVEYKTSESYRARWENQHGAARFGLGVYSASAEFDTFQSAATHHYARYLRVVEEVRTGASSLELARPTLNEFARGLNAVNFFRQCGTHFVRAEKRGARSRWFIGSISRTPRRSAACRS